MALPNIYSRRLRAAQPSNGDVYQYTIVPDKLRVQILHMINEVNLALVRRYEITPVLTEVVPFLRKEFGVGALSSGQAYQKEFDTWFLSEPDEVKLLDAIEVTFSVIESLGNERSRYGLPRAFSDELNARMLESGFGFQIENGQLVKLSSKYVHSEVVVPTLALLADGRYETANAEFRSAHAEFRAGEYEDCIHDCGNALETVLKTIIQLKGWSSSPNDTAKKLIATVFSNGLLPLHLQAEFNNLSSLLESATPSMRNKQGGHGAGPTPRNIPPYLAAFQLHQTAAVILLLVEAAK